MAKSGVKQASKAVVYYAKSTKTYYKDFAKSTFWGEVKNAVVNTASWLVKKILRW